MPEIQVQISPRLAFIPIIEETIVRIVDHHCGIRDTTLTICVLLEISDHPYIQEKTGVYVASTVAGIVNRMIDDGKLIAIDCESANFSYTYILPPDARISITVPEITIPIIEPESQTRH